MRIAIVGSLVGTEGGPDGSWSPEQWNEEYWGDIWANIEGPPFDRVVLVTGFFKFPPLNWRGRSGFVGLRILKEDGWHYGWVYVEKDAELAFLGGTITSYAYETEANTPILTVVPEPSAASIALMILLPALRRRRGSRIPNH